MLFITIADNTTLGGIWMILNDKFTFNAYPDRNNWNIVTKHIRSEITCHYQKKKRNLLYMKPTNHVISIRWGENWGAFKSYYEIELAKLAIYWNFNAYEKQYYLIFIILTLHTWLEQWTNISVLFVLIT